MLAKAREGDSGVKLEVNERILDSCTGLMKTIKTLIIRARDLQGEIIAEGMVLSYIHLSLPLLLHCEILEREISVFCEHGLHF